MRTVKSILRLAQNKKFTARPSITVCDALKRMKKYDLGALLVMKGEKILGIFSEQDYARKVILEDKSAKTTSIGEVMSTKVILVNTAYSLEECLGIMAKNRVRHLPVIDEATQQLLDFVSMMDVAGGIMKNKDYMIEQLTRYINEPNTWTPSVQVLATAV